MSSQLLATLLLFALGGTFCLTALHTALLRLQRTELKKSPAPNQVPLIPRSLLRREKSTNAYYAVLLTQNLLSFAYAVLTTLLSLHVFLANSSENAISPNAFPWSIPGWICLCLFAFLSADFLARLLGHRYPKKSIAWSAPLSSLLMILLFPLIFSLSKLAHFILQSYFDTAHESSQEAKQELIEMIEDCDLNTQLDLHDKKLIEAVMEFKDRIAREIMVPRVDIFSLPHDASIEDAATLIYREGYSRTPVYKHTLDNIIGVLMYKDVLAKYMEQVRNGDGEILKSPISTLIKNVLYTPETKKISHLLQEFRHQQVHLAIIVNEYGGTEGIITIEDILEEIVGDIADEYDQQETLFIPLPEGGWLIDARMNISDIEEQLGIVIPQHGDYDTIGGYIFHETGMIPPKGFVINTPYFGLEVVRSNSRRVEKLRIRALTPPAEAQQEFSADD